VCAVERLSFAVVSARDARGISTSATSFDGFFCDTVVVFALRFDIDFTWPVFVSKKSTFLESPHVAVSPVGFFVGFVSFARGSVFSSSETSSRDSSPFVVAEVASEACNEAPFERCVSSTVSGVDRASSTSSPSSTLTCSSVSNECSSEGVSSAALSTASNEELLRTEPRITEVSARARSVARDGVLLTGAI
jgi:hypothetical protein